MRRRLHETQPAETEIALAGVRATDHRQALHGEAQPIERAHVRERDARHASLERELELARRPVVQPPINLDVCLERHGAEFGDHRPDDRGRNRVDDDLDETAARHGCPVCAVCSSV